MSKVNNCISTFGSQQSTSAQTSTYEIMCPSQLGFNYYLPGPLKKESIVGSYKLKINSSNRIVKHEWVICICDYKNVN